MSVLAASCWCLAVGAATGAGAGCELLAAGCCRLDAGVGLLAAGCFSAYMDFCRSAFLSTIAANLKQAHPSLDDAQNEPRRA
jgi:hypothetical protein